MREGLRMLGSEREEMGNGDVVRDGCLQREAAL